LEKSKDDGFTRRLVMGLVTEQIDTEAHIAQIGVLVRALAKEQGVAMPEPGPAT
jgi:hypothetical protein